MKSKLVKFYLHQKFPYKNEKLTLFFNLELILFDYSEIVAKLATVKMRAVIEKEIRLTMHEIVLIIILCGFR